MLSEFKKHIEARFPQLLLSKVLVAVSGGVDSVVLLRLLHQCKISVAAAHCNFQLRGVESDKDEAFVKQLANEMNIPFYVKKFNTQQQANQNHESIQLTARKLRYKWFTEAASNNTYKYIATAHHLNDSLENFVMHTIRGTGIKGLLGVPEQTRNVIRPLLPFAKQQLLDYATQQSWKWREDASNQKNDYFRNRIRNQFIPLLEEENPNLASSFKQTLTHLNQTYQLVEDYTALLYKELITQEEKIYRINIKKLEKLPHPNAILYQLLNSFGFTDWESVYALKNAETGKKVTSDTHVLEKNRDELLIYFPHKPNNKEAIFISDEDKVVKFANSIIKLEQVEEIGEIDKHIAYIDAEKLQFPLQLRLVNKDDYFVPLGMKGSKKVNHFLRDEKVPTSIKKRTWVLCTKESIVWVLNHRINDAFKITEKTKKCLKISCLEK